METRLIFAYGSNLLLARIQARTPSVTVRGLGYVTRRCLTFRKLSRDGSGKADATWTGREEDRVWGVLHALSTEDRVALDACEPGYDLEPVSVHVADGEVVEALAYVAQEACTAEGLQPFAWYRAFVLDGAREQGLPAAYVAAIANYRARNDPNGFDG